MPDQNINCKRILIVDDQHDVAQSFAILLITMGHQVQFLTDPLETLEKVRQFRPEIIFLDIGMPQIDGWAVARTLRRDHDYGTLKLVAVTGYDTDADRAKSRVSGFDAHIVKPMSPELIESTLAQMSA